MLKKLLIACTPVLLFACNNESANTAKEDSAATTTSTTASTSGSIENKLTDEEKKDGWQLLFDGATTNGWHEYGPAPSSGLWKVDNGNLFFDGKQKADNKVQGDHSIVTDGDYTNFDLKLEWKVDTGSNSGVMFYVVEDSAKYKRPYHTGPEMQVLDNERHADAKIPKHRAGDLYDLISVSKETVKPALEWNQVEIKSLNGQLDFYLNGTNVVSTKMWDDNWKKMIANSKFKDMPGFGTFKTGKLCLQDHGNNVWYRNIKIKAL